MSGVCMTEMDASTPDVHVPPVAVFVCAAGHSGSTLLDLLLGSHPVAMSLGEITQLPKNLALNTTCSCGVPIRRCPTWTAVVERLAAQAIFRRLRNDPYALYLGLFEASTVVDTSHQTALRSLYRKVIYAGAYVYWRWSVAPLAAFARPVARGARNKWRLFDVIAELESKLILIDSSKHYLEAVALYRAAPQRTKVVLLIRDGRAVMYSGLKRGKSRRAAVDPWLRTYVRAAPLLERSVPSRDLLRVRYEDLTADPARELHRLCQFIGIKFDVDMLEFRAQRHHIANGNDMRFGKNPSIRTDQTWKSALSAADLAYFEARAGALNRRLGY
ncbi:MAG TPA: sulfotransferase [Vicinamibacterales bacterium]|nr:sulfotransferase [Vicinamibacterales bacterium]